MKIFHLLFLLTAFNVIQAQEVEFSLQRTANGYEVYADSREPIPVTAMIQLDLTNLKTDDSVNITRVIKPMASHQLVTAAKIVNKSKKFGIRYNVKTTLGDHTTEWDRDFVYNLPWSVGESYRVDQGYNGQISHMGENAIDFNMPVGTVVRVVRGGIVAKVEESNDKHCQQPSCEQYNNYVIVYHEDGTFAEYVHLKHMGSTVEKGHVVEQGEIIGYSGNTGWSTGPHLHLIVYGVREGQRTSLSTKFRVDDEDTGVHLLEDKSYTRRY